MPNFAVALKDEIRRLARKEIRVQVTATKRAAAQHRRDIARLKREIKAQEKRMGVLISRVQEGVSSPAESADDFDNSRFSSRSVRAQRRRLGFSAEDYGKLVGVSGQTIYHWEQGKARPRKSQMAGLVAVRGIGKREALARLSDMPVPRATKRRKPGRPRGRKPR